MLQMVSNQETELVTFPKEQGDLLVATAERLRKVAGYPGGVKGGFAAQLDIAADWYLNNCLLEDRTLLVSYMQSSVWPVDSDYPIFNLTPQIREVKVMKSTLPKLEQIQSTMKEHDGVWVDLSGPNVGRGMNPKAMSKLQYVIVSLYLYAYENGVLCDSALITRSLPKHGKNMSRGCLTFRSVELVISRHDLAYRVGYCGRSYSIEDGLILGENPSVRGIQMLQQIVAEQEQVEEISHDEGHSFSGR